MPVPAHLPPLDRNLLREGVHQRLRDAIVDGTLAPGEQLRDQELAAWLGVSRTPVREALLRLAGSGLVEARPGRSTTVTPVDPRAVREARDVVAAMHQVAVREAVPALSAADLDAMRDAAQRFRAAWEAGDVDAALAADDELHGVPVTVAGNRAVASVLDQFTPLLRRAERLRFASLSGRTSLALHDQLVDLCAQGEVEQASAVAYDTWHGLDTDPTAPDQTDDED
jgi:DNA-binding GntR family transcriptional regulator